MFAEQDFDVIGFESSWKNKRVFQDQILQTTEFSTQEKGINTTSSCNIQIQTDPIQNNKYDTDAEMAKLAKWLKNIYPKIVDELNDQSLSKAMAACKYMNMSSSVIVSMLQEVNITGINQYDKKKGMFVSSLSWNCTGNTLAVSCNLKHDVWCHHLAEIRLYSFDRNEKLSTVPTKKLNCGACVTDLSFHPYQPSILSAGTVSGEVYLWDIQDEGDSLLSSYTGHEDRISLVSWVTPKDSKSSTILVTASLDAYVIVWKINESTLNIDKKYKPQHYMHKIYSSGRDVIPKRVERGIVCIDFSPHVPGLFVTAMEGGYILKCSLLGAKVVPGSKTPSATLDPYISSYNGHEGEVTMVIFSPHRKELFASCGTDDQIKIFHIEQESPLQIIFVDVTLSCISWISCESKLLIGAGVDGSLKLFSLRNGQQISMNTSFTTQSLTSMAVNNKRVNMLAVGDNEGVLKLWSVPWNNIATQDNVNVYK